jgi:two-component system chemotaxis response regulator CheY
MLALIIDDSRAMRMILGRILSAEGYTIRDASDGPAALELLATGLNPDLVLVDWHMPEMEGIEVVAAIRAEPIAYPGKIVMVTTETEMSQMVRALDAGADEYLMKPFTAEAVTEKLQLLGLA